MRYLKMTLPAIILVIILAVALVIYPDMAKSYQEKEAAAQAQQTGNDEDNDANAQPSDSDGDADTKVLSSEETESTSAEVRKSAEESVDDKERSTEESSIAELSDKSDGTAEKAGNDSLSGSALINTAPDFEIRDAFGIDGRLSDHFGKPIVVNFWATWCPYCVQELPLFDEYAMQYSDDINFLIVDLADGYRETIGLAKKYVDEYGYSFPVYFDTTGGSMRAYGITGIPVTLFIDANGNLMTQHVGAIDEDTLAGNVQALGVTLQ